MNIDVRPDSLTEAAALFERLSAEWREAAEEIRKITNENSTGSFRLTDCSELIKEYAGLLGEIAEKYETNEKKISMISGDVI